MIEYIENSGESIETAIIIKGAPDHFKGVDAEYIYLAKIYGVRGEDWKLKQQSLLEKDRKHFDKLEIILSDGTEKTIYFDISDFYGKF